MTYDAEKARSYRLLKTYGITGEQYDLLLSRQGGVCAICLRPPGEEGPKFAVDHNHKTGEVRGVLCNYCNHRVVGRHTDGEVMQRVADYLRRGTGWFVPLKKRSRPRKKRVKK